jgi:hypothetical protein
VWRITGRLDKGIQEPASHCCSVRPAIAALAELYSDRRLLVLKPLRIVRISANITSRLPMFRACGCVPVSQGGPRERTGPGLIADYPCSLWS